MSILLSKQQSEIQSGKEPAFRFGANGRFAIPGRMPILVICDSGPKAHKVIAQGNALGIRFEIWTSPNEAEWMRGSCRPFRALVFVVSISWGVAPGYHIAPRWGKSQSILQCAPLGQIALASHLAPLGRGEMAVIR